MFDRWRWPPAALLATLTLTSLWWADPFLDWLQINQDWFQSLAELILILLALLTLLATIGPRRTDDPAALARAEAEDRRGLAILRDKVQQEVRERINGSLFQQLRIALGHERDPGAVATSWARELECPDRPAEPLPANRTTAAVFDDSAGALLILGAPGAGKTVELLHLAQALLGRDPAPGQQRNGPDDPVPVVLNLSSWDDPALPLADWIGRELKRRFLIPPKLGPGWVAHGRLTLLLDGLDEVAAPRRAACAEAINTFRAEHGLTRLAVCCRDADYRALPTLQLGAALRLLPLDRGQIEQYLIQAGPALAGLRQALAEGPDLARLADSPLMLNVMSLTYRDRPRTAFTAPIGGPGALFDAHLARVFQRKADGTAPEPATRRRPLPDSPWTEAQTRRWLGRLALGMQRRGRTFFQIEDLQPDCVNRGFWFVALVAVVALFMVVVFGLLGLAEWLPFGRRPGLVDWLISSAQMGLFAGVATGLR